MCKSVTDINNNNNESVCASAPGKAILFGEHAVVFGEPAVAAALSDLRIYVKVTPATEMRIRMPDLPTPLDIVFDNTNSGALCLDSLSEPPTKNDTETIRSALLSQVPTMNEFHVSALIPLIYLMNRLTPDHVKSGLHVLVRSQDLPVGAGLGSSAAFGVACAAALLKLSSSKRGLLGKPSPEDLETINTYSFYSEMLLHGTPSGIDNAVSTFGGAIDYTKKKDGRTTMEKFDMPPLFNMILANTHVPRSTKTLVAGVRSLYEQHPKVVGSILSCMGHIANDFRTTTTLSTNDFHNANDELLTLVRTNQHMLRSVGVSHPSLDRICEVVDEVSNGAAAAKLTGAGGGGCAMIVLQSSSKTLSREIQGALENGKHPWNYTCLQSAVGQEGVLWVNPALMQEEEKSHHSTFRGRYALLAGAVVGSIAVVAAAAFRKR